MLDLFGQGQRTQEVAEIEGEGVQLDTHGVVTENMAGQTRPVNGVLAFLDPLLRRASSIVEPGDPLGSGAWPPSSYTKPR